MLPLKRWPRRRQSSRCRGRRLSGRSRRALRSTPSGIRATSNGWRRCFRCTTADRLVGALVILVDAGYIRDQGYDRLAAELLADRGDGGADCCRHVPDGALVPDAAADARGGTAAAPADGALREGSFTRRCGTESFQSAGSRSGDDGGEPDCGARGGGGRSPAARRRGAFLDRGAAGRAHAEQRRAGRIFVVSNREPYMHVRKGRKTTCVVPPERTGDGD